MGVLIVPGLLIVPRILAILIVPVAVHYERAATTKVDAIKPDSKVGEAARAVESGNGPEQTTRQHDGPRKHWKLYDVDKLRLPRKEINAIKGKMMLPLI